MPNASRHRVTALAYQRLSTFEFSIAVEIFGIDRSDMGVPWYEFATASEDGKPVSAVGGIKITPSADLSALQHSDTIVIPGWPTDGTQPSPALKAALQQAHARGARLLSICSGAFLLAACGLLDGKGVTTHWMYADKFRTRFPHIKLSPDVLYIDADDIMTSAGSSAGIDLLLHLVRKDYGSHIANRVAKRLVMAPHRAGGQLQFTETPVEPDGHKLASLMDAVRASLDTPWTVEDMAAEVAMSLRTFCRRFKQSTGLSPAQWLVGIRVTAAQNLLENSPLSIKEIAQKTGFGASENFFRRFKARVGVNPSTYRAQFLREPAV